MSILCPVVAVGAVVWRGPEQLLLVRRGRPPRLGEWSIPGGRIEIGETLHEALSRELREETGLSVSIERLIDVRAYPVSRRRPHFSRQPLAATLGDAGIASEWRGQALGAMRKGGYGPHMRP